MRECTKCLRGKPESEFYPSCHSQCKDCIDAVNNKWAKDNPVGRKIISDRFAANHPEKKTEYRKNRERRNMEIFDKEGITLESKFCNLCFRDLSAADFNANPRKSGGLDSNCRECVGRARRYKGSFDFDRRNNLRSCSRKEFYLVIQNPCIYCGVMGLIGADRIDNARGHEIDNILPCCYECNIVRNNIFSVLDMIKIFGPAVRQWRIQRGDKLAEPGKYDYTVPLSIGICV